MNINHQEDHDFVKLGEKYPEVKRYLNPSGYNFQDHDALCALTKAILHEKFNLNLKLSKERLCPRVPNRLKYIHWIFEILKESYYHESINLSDEKIIGIDIGVGCSCIYPLLGCSLYKGWKMIGTDIDPLAISQARENVKNNLLSDRITLIQKTDKDKMFIFLDSDISNNQTWDFTMCNPPFYESEQDMKSSKEFKELNPSSILIASNTELITNGGEYKFIMRMLLESIENKDRVKWFTTMVGKLQTVKGIVDEFRSLKIENYAVHELTISKSPTRRWFIGWSFQQWRVPNRLSHPKSSALRKFSPASASYKIHIPSVPISQFFDKVLKLIKSISGLSCAKKEHSNSSVIIVKSVGNVWSRSHRRKIAKEEERIKENRDNYKRKQNDDTRIRFICEIRTNNEDIIELLWRYGEASNVFDSFCGFIKGNI